MPYIPMPEGRGFTALYDKTAVNPANDNKGDVNAMTQTKLAESVSRVSGVPEGATERVINFTIETILKTVQNGESVVFPGFGKFFLASYEERLSNNPRTGEQITVPARKALRFKASSKVKDTIN